MRESAISPIVGGDAIKGPTAKIMRELHQPVSAVGIARHYAGLLDGLIIDTMDRDMVTELERLGVRVAICETIMKSLQDKISLARVTLDCVSSLAPT